MKPVRSRILAAIALALLLLGLFGSVADARGGFTKMSFPEDPWPTLSN
ncbi:MAG TPA: hypothetical protein VIA63_02525 [Candidatus Limnocylindria bacterium]|jgi:hypothetical protein